MKVMMLGLRGFPNVQGGVETHVENLCPLLRELGCDMHVIVRSPYQPPDIRKEWRGVRLHVLWAPKGKSLEAIVHSFLGVLYAGLYRPDILHIQAIGPSLAVPLARLLGLKVVVTSHGPDYDRQKWGTLARFALRLGERFGMRWSHGRIVISAVIQKAMSERYGVSCALIGNGVTLPDLPKSSAALERFGLEAGRYVLLVSRLVPEKNHLHLIEAYAQAGLAGWKLVLVGASDHPDSYTRQVSDLAAQNSDVVCTGFQSGLALAELYTHAGFFVLPSSHEGLPIALLEALSYGLPVLASDIPANIEIGLPADQYFPVGAISALAEKLRDYAKKPCSAGFRESQREWVAHRYDWRQIAEQTLSFYRTVLGKDDSA